jgi:hypothetical protein
VAMDMQVAGWHERRLTWWVGQSNWLGVGGGITPFSITYTAATDSWKSVFARAIQKVKVIGRFSYSVISDWFELQSIHLIKLAINV